MSLLEVLIKIGTSAVIRKEKNISLLVLAFGATSQVSDLLLIIVGDLPEFVSLKNLIN